MTAGTIRKTVTGAVALVTIDAPPVNAFSMAMYEALTSAFTELSADPAVHCIILTGEGSRAFSAGMDIFEFQADGAVRDDERQAIGLRAFEAIDACPIPVIGAINGVALGAGAAFAALCDIRIASESATFGLPEINVGRAGGAAFMARHVPPGLLRRMFFTGAPITAAEAHRVGLVQQLTLSEELLSFAMELATTIASKSPIGLRTSKESLRHIEHLSALDGYSKEQKFSADLVSLADSREALEAFIEKRLPRFTGR